MSRVELPELPQCLPGVRVQHDDSGCDYMDPARGYRYFSDDQMRAYGIACAKAALEAAVQQADATRAKIEDWINDAESEMSDEEVDAMKACALLVRVAVIDIRALAVGSGGAK